MHFSFRFVAVFGAFWAAGMSPLAHAAPPTPESIERLLVLSKSDKLLDAIKPQIQAMSKGMMEQALQGKKPTPEEQKVLDKFAARMVEVMGEGMSMTAMKPMMVETYAANFTQEEIDGISAFYASPVGQSMINKMPAVMQSVMAGMPKRMAPMIEKLKAAGDEMATELKALRAAK